MDMVFFFFLEEMHLILFIKYLDCFLLKSCMKCLKIFIASVYNLLYEYSDTMTGYKSEEFTMHTIAFECV